MTTSETWHGTLSGYTNKRCRCKPCRAAMTAYHGHHSRDACVMPTGTTSACGQIATHLNETQAEVARVARLANASPRAFAKYSSQLARAKQFRADAIKRRDEHMAECPGAADRFGASA